MNERQLRYVKTIAQEGSIKGASFLLGKNPSTLTRGLKSLEEELETVIFKRTRDGLTLTGEGIRMNEWVGEILSRFEELEEWTGVSGHLWTENEMIYLLTIEEQGNISRAAQELYVAQPSLSQAVMELEEDLGREIFRRTKGGVQATAFGEGLLKRLRNIKELYRQMREELEEFRQMRRGIITIGIPMNLGTYLLPLVLPAFSEQYPGIQIRIRENNSGELERLMLAGRIDFCIMHFHEEKPQVQYQLFQDDPFCLVVPSRAKWKPVLPKDRTLLGENIRCLENIPFVMVASRQKLRLVVDQILENAGVIPRIHCTTKSMETAKRLVAAGMGVTFLPRSYLNLYSGTEGLESYPVDESLGASWKLAVAYPAEGKLSRASMEFLRMLEQELSGQENRPQ